MEHMPRGELAHCHGIMFTTVYKGGIGVGFEHGHGFVIAKHPSDATGRAHTRQTSPSWGKSWTWSAPMCVTVNAGSFGATLGVSKIDSVRFRVHAPPW